MSLSFDANTNATPIAIMRNKHGEKRGIVYYNQDLNDDVEIELDDITDEILNYCYGKTITRTHKAKDKLRMELLKEVEAMDEKEKRIIRNLKPKDDCAFFPLVLGNDWGERDSFYISGQAGSGKSRFVMKLVELYKKLGLNRIFVISSKDGDKEAFKKVGVNDYIDIEDLVEDKGLTKYYEALNEYKSKKIKLKHMKQNYDIKPNDLLELEIEIEKMKPTPTMKNKHSFEPTEFYKKLTTEPSLFIFDDYETLPRKKLEACQWFIDYLLVNERSRGVNVIVINHKNTNGIKGSHVLNECGKFVIFKRNLPKSYNYLLGHYLGMSSKDIQRVADKLKSSNFVMIDRLNRYVIAEKSVYLL